MKKLIETTKKYVQAKIEMTECKQRNFKQLCSRCRFYSNCNVYSNYCDCWMKLERLVGE